MSITFRADPATQEFVDLAGRGEFLLHRDPSTGRVYGPQDTRTEHTPAEAMLPFAASGRATVVSFTFVHGRPDANGVTPRSVVAIGELDEGPWWWAEVEDADPDEVKTGSALRIAFRELNDGQHVPVFTLA
ncbi:Zn-ribbon domain-containing OB-fold protein [Nocardioides terrisoli]|uniref:Zn-ribbon domain-containing OB-fold protein n=1 Tax=Nocardioides terrisoli TaxID=3388267 RepID=UPI00287BBC3E|nr:OB-fold domain-containing protein [Nocardioides marmorisolisilvae]